MHHYGEAMPIDELDCSFNSSTSSITCSLASSCSMFSSGRSMGGTISSLSLLSGQETSSLSLQSFVSTSSSSLMTTNSKRWGKQSKQQEDPVTEEDQCTASMTQSSDTRDSASNNQCEVEAMGNVSRSTIASKDSIPQIPKRSWHCDEPFDIESDTDVIERPSAFRWSKHDSKSSQSSTIQEETFNKIPSRWDSVETYFDSFSTLASFANDDDATKPMSSDSSTQSSSVKSPSQRGRKKKMGKKKNQKKVGKQTSASTITRSDANVKEGTYLSRPKSSRSERTLVDSSNKLDSTPSLRDETGTKTQLRKSYLSKRNTTKRQLLMKRRSSSRRSVVDAALCSILEDEHEDLQSPSPTDEPYCSRQCSSTTAAAISCPELAIHVEADDAAVDVIGERSNNEHGWFGVGSRNLGR